MVFGHKVWLGLQESVSVAYIFNAFSVKPLVLVRALLFGLEGQGFAGYLVYQIADVFIEFKIVNFLSSNCVI